MFLSSIFWGTFLWAVLLCMTHTTFFSSCVHLQFSRAFSVGCVAMYDPYHFFFIVCSSSVFQGIFCRLCCCVGRISLFFTLCSSSVFQSIFCGLCCYVGPISLFFTMCSSSVFQGIFCGLCCCERPISLFFTMCSSSVFQGIFCGLCCYV